MKERPYRILFCGKDRESFDILLPNYFANYKYVKVKCINAGVDSIDYTCNIGLFCNDHYYDAYYGEGITLLERPEFNPFMFNISTVINGSKSVYAYLPYRDRYRFYMRNLTNNPVRTELSLILELEPINFN